MSNNYKGQFTEWSPAYPAIFHGSKMLVSENTFKMNVSSNGSASMKTHSITINAINKAMKK